jgi:hypothetical protein
LDVRLIQHLTPKIIRLRHVNLQFKQKAIEANELLTHSYNEILEYSAISANPEYVQKLAMVDSDMPDNIQKSALELLFVGPEGISQVKFARLLNEEAAEISRFVKRLTEFNIV